MSIFGKIGSLFTSPKAQAIAHAIEMAALEAEPIIQMTSLLVPNRNFQNIAAAYEKYGVPFTLTEMQLQDPLQQGLAMRDLTTAILRKNHADASANTLNAAVEIALAAAKAG